MTRKAVHDETTLGESVVDEVRAIREAIDEEVNHDVRRLAERVRRAGEEIRRQYGLKAATTSEASTGAAGQRVRG